MARVLLVIAYDGRMGVTQTGPKFLLRGVAMKRFTKTDTPLNGFAAALAFTVVGAVASTSSTIAQAAPDVPNRCSNTAAAADTACRKDAAATYWLTDGMCENMPAPAARSTCIRDAKSVHQDDL